MLNSRETSKFKYEFKDCHVRLEFCLEKLFKLLGKQQEDLRKHAFTTALSVLLSS